MLKVCLGLFFLAVLGACSAKNSNGGVPKSLTKPTEMAPGCVHPAVEAACFAGWCRIPAGCYINGSPDSEPQRLPLVEQATPVTLTHSFVIQQTELTQRDWTAQGLPKTGHGYDYWHDCYEDACPVGDVNWQEAAYFANLLSERHVPPLKPCYELTECAGTVGGIDRDNTGIDKPFTSLHCKSVALSAPTVYECEGFRLPTEAEWQYAARAGTRTAFYAGDITPQPESASCTADAVLEKIAWYCANSANNVHLVKQKRPNSWGLFDTLGNSYEWVHDADYSSSFSGPVTDPRGTLDNTPWRAAKGGGCNAPAKMLRAANHHVGRWDAEGFGVRLVRTLQPGEVWPSASSR